MKSFNINHDVWIYLTDYGKTVIKEDEYAVKMLNFAKKKDYNGETYYRLQMYDVMQIFGKYLYCGGTPPIGLTILLEDENDNFYEGEFGF